MRKQFFTALFFFFTTAAFSQKGKIEGYIADAENKTPLSGATVIVSGNKGDNTNAFGKFSITHINPGQYELVVSHVSYKTEVIPVEVKENLISSISIALKKTNLDLAEVKISGKKKCTLFYYRCCRHHASPDQYFTGRIADRPGIVYCATCRRWQG